ncbi:MAG: hypothetical protein R2710_06860 [Acidimicrobiales bacterium]
MEHPGGAAGSGDVARQVAEQHGPAEHRAQQLDRCRVLDEIDEDGRAAGQVPSALVGVVEVESEPGLAGAPVPVVGGRLVELAADRRKRVAVEHAGHRTDRMLAKVVLGSLEIVGRVRQSCGHGIDGHEASRLMSPR